MNRDEVDYLFTTEGHLIPLRSKELLEKSALHKPLDEQPAASARRRRPSPKRRGAAARAPKRSTFQKAAPRVSGTSRMSLFSERPLRAALRNATIHPNPQLDKFSVLLQAALFPDDFES